MSFIRFVATKYLLQGLLFSFGFILLLIYARFFSGHKDLDWLDPIIGFATFFVAIVVWFNSIKKDYDESLEKRLTVYFRFGGRNVLVCYDALLYHVSDARAWSQQIGSQMAGGAFLKMDPFYHLEDCGVKIMPKSKKIVRSYNMTFFLTQLPVFGDKETSSELKEKFRIEMEGGCWEWYPVENENGSFKVDKIYVPGIEQVIRV